MRRGSPRLRAASGRPAAGRCAVRRRARRAPRAPRRRPAAAPHFVEVGARAPAQVARFACRPEAACLRRHAFNVPMALGSPSRACSRASDSSIGLRAHVVGALRVARQRAPRATGARSRRRGRLAPASIRPWHTRLPPTADRFSPSCATRQLRGLLRFPRAPLRDGRAPAAPARGRPCRAARACASTSVRQIATACARSRSASTRRPCSQASMPSV